MGTRFRRGTASFATGRFYAVMLRGMKVIVVGCSPAWPNPGGAQSGYLVEGSGRLLLDCGPGVLPRLREQEGWPRVDAIVITHFHLDHWGDLVPWAFGVMYGPGRDVPKPRLLVPPGGGDELDLFADKLGVEGMFAEAFDVSEYPENEPFEAAGLEVTAIRVPHYQHCPRHHGEGEEGADVGHLQERAERE